MWTLIKLAVVALSIYAAITASPQDQMAMAQGGRAFGRAIFEACTRSGSPCAVVGQHFIEFARVGFPTAPARSWPDR